MCLRRHLGLVRKSRYFPSNSRRNGLHSPIGHLENAWQKEGSRSFPFVTRRTWLEREDWRNCMAIVCSTLGASHWGALSCPSVNEEACRNVKNGAQIAHAAQVWCEKSETDAHWKQTTLQNAEDAINSASDARIVDVATVGLTIASAAADTVTSPSATNPSISARVWQNTIYRQPSKLEEEEAKTKVKLSELSFASATESIHKFVGDGTDDALHLPDGTTFTIVDLGAMNTLLTFAKCKICNGALEIVQDKREYVKLRFMCANCGATASV